MIVPCECGAKLKIDDAKVKGKAVKVKCPRCGNILSAQAPASAAPATARRPVTSMQGPLVLVAHDSEVVRSMISKVLREAGFFVEEASDGHEALKKATELSPRAMVLDVGLSGIYGFELCERLKGDKRTVSIKIVLLSSVYDMRRYKRSPVSLYGADDYIEKHHLTDFLPQKLHNLINPHSFNQPALPPEKEKSVSPVASREFDISLFKTDHAAQAALEQAERHSAQPAGRRTEVQEAPAITPESISLDASIFQKEECDMPSVDEADPEAVEKAKRFARIIVSDIALYNQEAVVEGVTNGTLDELLKADMIEGRDLYEKRIPEIIRLRKDYFQEAFDNFVSAQEKIVR